VRALELESNTGFRLGFGRLFSSGWDATVTYTYFHTSDNQDISAPMGGRLWAHRIHPNNGQAFGNAAASANLDMDVFDLEGGYWFRPNDCISTRVFGGIRAANVDQTFGIAYTNPLTGGGAANTVINESVRMDGYGVRVGGEGHWWIRERLSIFARGAGSVLVGDFHTRYQETGAANRTPIDVTYEYFQAVPVLETALGVNYQRGNWSFQGGYELATWFNMANRVSFHENTNNQNNATFSSGSNDLLLDGLFGRVVFVR
jgi:hypothetical protein